MKKGLTNNLDLIRFQVAQSSFFTKSIRCTARPHIPALEIYCRGDETNQRDRISPFTVA